MVWQDVQCLCVVRNGSIIVTLLSGIITFCVESLSFLLFVKIFFVLSRVVLLHHLDLLLRSDLLGIIWIVSSLQYTEWYLSSTI